jgi:hypothetical protein
MDGKEVSRREFVKKMAYLTPAIAILVTPKYSVAQACTAVCPANCQAVCPPRCDFRCPTVCSAFCKKQ